MVLHSDAPGSIIGHRDTGSWHIVARDGLPVGLIDWALAGPTDRRDEIAATAWWNAQLYDDIAEGNQLPDATARRRSCGTSSTATSCLRRSGPAWSPT